MLGHTFPALLQNFISNSLEKGKKIFQQLENLL